MVLKSADTLVVQLISAVGSPIVNVVASFQDPERPPDRQLTQITQTSVYSTVLDAPGSGSTRMVPELTVKNSHLSGGAVVANVVVLSGGVYYGLFQATLAAGDALTYQKGHGFKVNCDAITGTNLATIIAQALPSGVSIADVLKQIPLFDNILI